MLIREESYKCFVQNCSNKESFLRDFHKENGWHIYWKKMNYCPIQCELCWQNMVVIVKIIVVEEESLKGSVWLLVVIHVSVQCMKYHLSS